MKQLIIFFLCIINSLLSYAQGYKGLVEDFYNALGNKDFTSAYGLCTGKNWGTLEQFSSAEMYGGIYDIAFSKCEYKKSELPNTVEALVDIFIKDSVNGDGRFVQNFYLVQQSGKWRIRRISLLQTDRAENGWNLKLTEQAGLTKKELEAYLKPVYDTASRLSADGESIPKLKRNITTPKFFQTPDGIYAAVVVENGCEDCSAAYVGWCDVFVFKQNGKQWKMTDRMLHAGGGGMYGSPGIAEKPLLRIGTSITGLVLTGGQYHMGDLLSFDNILSIEKGRLSQLVSVATHYDNEGSGRESGRNCQEIDYRFLSSGKAHYDMQLISTNCLGKEKETGRKIIAYTNKGYTLPDEYIIEM